MKKAWSNTGLVVLLLTISLKQQAQVMDVSVVNTGNNVIRIVGVPTAPGFSAAPNNAWTDMNITWRIPKAASVPAPTVAPPAITPEITGESTAFTGASPRDAFNNTGLDLAVFDLTTFGQADDGYWYFQVTGTTGNVQSIATGASVVLYEFTTPVAWICPGCVEILTSDVPGLPISTTSFIDNAGLGLDVLNLVVNNAPLPVDFLSFEAVKAADNVNLTWRTTHERNVKGYYPERRSDGGSWTSLGFVAVAPSGIENTYRFTDITPWKGNNYYRIRETDLDGKPGYSATKLVQFGNGGGFTATVYPVPAIAQLKVNIHAGVNEAATLRILDAQGSTIELRSIQLKLDGNLETIEVGHYRPGVYVIELKGATIKWTSKFIRGSK